MPKRRHPAAPLDIRWTERALDDLVAIGDFISRDTPAAAHKHVARLISLVESAARFPLAGRMVPEVGDPRIREKLLDNYRIVYRVKGGSIEVLTVFEGHRLTTFGPGSAG